MPPEVGGGGAGSDGAIGVGAGFGTRFLAFALLAGFAFFITPCGLVWIRVDCATGNRPRGVVWIKLTGC